MSVNQFFNEKLSLDQGTNADYSWVRGFLLRTINPANAAEYGIIDPLAQDHLPGLLALIETQLPPEQPVEVLNPLPETHLPFKSHGHRFPMFTLFDLIGWIFSVSHSRREVDKPDNFCIPLLKIYRHFCQTLSPDGTEGHFTVALAYFEDPNSYCILGANLSNIQGKHRIRGQRKDALERSDSRLKNISDPSKHIGSCAETWFLYLISNKLPPDPATAHGLAFQTIYDPPDNIRCLPPCPTCEEIMEVLDLNFGNFRPPFTQNAPRATH